MFAVITVIAFIIVMMIATVLSGVLNFINHALNNTYNNVTKAFPNATSINTRGFINSNVNTLATYFAYFVDAVGVIVIIGFLIGIAQKRKV